MPADIFDDLYIHTCTVVRATAITAEDPLNPQGGTLTGVDFTSPAATTSGIRCRFMPIAAGTRLTLGESEASQKAGTVVASHLLQIPFGAAPATLTDLDSVPDPAVIHRITNVLDPSGVVMNTGPLDIVYIYDPSGDGQALLLLLKRVA